MTMGPLRGKMSDYLDKSRVGKSRNVILKTVFEQGRHRRATVDTQQKVSSDNSAEYEPGSFDDAVESSEEDPSEAGDAKRNGSLEAVPQCEINSQQAAGDIPVNATTLRDFSLSSLFKQGSGFESPTAGDGAGCQGYQTAGFSLARLYAALGGRNSEAGGSTPLLGNEESDPCARFFSGGGRPVARGSASAPSEVLLHGQSSGFHFLNRGRGSRRANRPVASSNDGDCRRAGVETDDPVFGQPDILYGSPPSQTHPNPPVHQLSVDMMGQGSTWSRSGMPDSVQNWSVDLRGGYDDETCLSDCFSHPPECRAPDKAEQLTHNLPKSFVYDGQSYDHQQSVLASDNCADGHRMSALLSGSAVKMQNYEENRAVSDRYTELDQSDGMFEREPIPSYDAQHANAVSSKTLFGECRKCGKEGHYARDCQLPFLCRKCGKEGHFGGACPTTLCHWCGQDGHVIKNCPAIDCKRCGKSGHMARDCTVYSQANVARRGLDSGEETVGRLRNDQSDGALDSYDSKRRPGDGGEFGVDDNLRSECHQDDNKPFLYFPPPPPEDEEHIFETLLKGINFRKFYDMTVECTGRNPPTECMGSFFNGDLSRVIQENVKKTGYDEPTPIQKWAIPVILSGRDLMACALTGSGKTAAYLLPLLTKMICNGTVARANDVQMPEVLVLSPSRELATQIFLEARKFSHNTAIRSAVVYGGVARSYLQRQLSEGVHLIVATIGKLLELLRRRWISLRNVKYIVLDEADRLMDMGFLPDLRAIVSNFDLPVKGKRQAMMFSATLPDKTQILADKILNDYIFIAVGSVGGASRDVEQVVQKVQASEKLRLLTGILRGTGKDRVLIFVALKRNAKFITHYLLEAGFPTAGIHSDLNQKEREDGLRSFRSGDIPVLVASSVAARGLDIPEVMHVVNYDMPDSIEEYIHRIGRTGRCGNLGKATSFFDPAIDADLTRALVRVLADANQIIPEWLEEMASCVLNSRASKERHGNHGSAKDLRKKGN